jgi:hypothetical protein
MCCALFSTRGASAAEIAEPIVAKSAGIPLDQGPGKT